MDFASLINEIGRGAKSAQALSRDAAARLFAAMLSGDLPDLELGAALIALRVKGETTDELIGFKTALDARTKLLPVPSGPRCVVLPSYNGARLQANLMPLVALLLARDGIPVLIHGHRNDGRENTVELLDAFGIMIADGIATAVHDLEARRLAALNVDQLVPNMTRLLDLRKRLGVRNCAHSMAKLIDPCPGRSVRLVPITHMGYYVKMDAVLCADGGRALLMRGTEGEAYANPQRCPRMRIYANGKASTIGDKNLPQAQANPPAADLAIANNVAAIHAMLNGDLPVPAPLLVQVETLKALALG
jgi:anthranilate phosphoribosyltransferase